MQNKVPDDLAKLQVLIREKFASHLVRWVFRDDLPVQVRRRLSATLDKIRFSGFRPGKRPEDRVGQAMFQSKLVESFGAGRLRGALQEFILTWGEANLSRVEAVGDALASRRRTDAIGGTAISSLGDIRFVEELALALGMPTGDTVLALAILQLKEHGPASEASSAPQGDMVAETTPPDDGAGAEAVISSSDLRLAPDNSSADQVMFSAAAGNIADSPEMQLSDRWKGILLELEALGAESSEWERVEAFLAQATLIAQSKATERIPRRRIAEILTELGAFEDEIEYFDINSVRGWTTYYLHPSKLAITLIALENLLASLLAFRTVRTTRCGKRHEEMRRREEEERLEMACSSLFDELSVLFARDVEQPNIIANVRDVETDIAIQYSARDLSDSTLVSASFTPELTAMRNAARIARVVEPVEVQKELDVVPAELDVSEISEQQAPIMNDETRSDDAKLEREPQSEMVRAKKEDSQSVAADDFHWDEKPSTPPTGLPKATNVTAAAHTQNSESLPVTAKRDEPQPVAVDSLHREEQGSTRPSELLQVATHECSGEQIVNSESSRASLSSSKRGTSQPISGTNTKRPSVLSDEQLADNLMKFAWNESTSSEIVTDWIAEQQARWLIRGENLRAYLLARRAEQAAIVAEQIMPGWLCWLAIVADEPGFNPVEPSVAEIAPMLFKLANYSREEQRFAMAWLSAGLLGQDPTRTMEMTPHLSREVHSLPWLAESTFYQFCAEHLLGPARQNRRPQLKTHEPVDAIRTRLRREISEARNIMSLNSAYRNTQVSRFWAQLVRREGPVYALITAVEREAVDVPSAEALAQAAPGWGAIIGEYGHNIIMRLEKIVLHLQQAVVLHGILQSRATSQANVLPLERVHEAICDGEETVKELIAVRSPSAYGFWLALSRLRDALPEKERDRHQYSAIHPYS